MFCMTLSKRFIFSYSSKMSHIPDNSGQNIEAQKHTPPHEDPAKYDPILTADVFSSYSLT